jgi:hypothetical protein
MPLEGNLLLAAPQEETLCPYAWSDSFCSAAAASEAAPAGTAWLSGCSGEANGKFMNTSRALTILGSAALGVALWAGAA